MTKSQSLPWRTSSAAGSLAGELCLGGVTALAGLPAPGGVLALGGGLALGGVVFFSRELGPGGAGGARGSSGAVSGRSCGCGPTSARDSIIKIPAQGRSLKRARQAKVRNSDLRWGLCWGLRWGLLLGTVLGSGKLGSGTSSVAATGESSTTST